MGSAGKSWLAGLIGLAAGCAIGVALPLGGVMELPTARAERVNVQLQEVDGEDRVTISQPHAAEALA